MSSIPDSDYNEAEYLQKDIPADESIRWGLATNGMRLGIVRKSPVVLTEVDDPHSVRLFVQNVSDQAVRFHVEGYIAEWVQVQVTGAHGAYVRTEPGDIPLDLPAFPTPWRLKPGEKLELCENRLTVVSPKTATEATEVRGPRSALTGARAAPGHFTAKYVVPLNWRRVIRGKNEWSGRLISSSIPVQVVAANDDEGKRQRSATGQIDGQLIDENGTPAEIGQAAVFLCDAATGYPILATTNKPLDLKSPPKDWIFDVRHAVTDEHGAFAFDELPPGIYRLVAQSWAGAQGIPWLAANRRPGPFGKTPSEVRLHGVAEQVEIAGDGTTRVNVRSLGNGSLAIVNDPEEANAFLFLSSRPPIGDPILGPLSWGDEFVNGLFAVTHMSEPHVTFMGLPSGQEIHASLLNYDNNPGFGGGSYRVGEARRVPLRILAGWSNGHCDPPARLLTLVEHLEERRLDLSQLLGLPDTDVHNARELNRLATEIPNREIEVKGLGKLRLIDLLAASRYNYLRSHHKARSNKNSAAGTN
jgi:hypothetical protein